MARPKQDPRKSWKVDGNITIITWFLTTGIHSFS